MAHVTTPRLLSPVSRRIVVIVIAAAAALMLLTSLLVSNATAAATVEIIEGTEGDACQALGYGVDAEEFVIPSSGGRYSATFDLGDGVSVSLNSPPNRKFVDFKIANATVNGAILFNRVDQDQGTWYDYDPAVAEGRLEPPPRDSGNDKKVVLCFAAEPAISISATTNGADGSFIPVGDPVTWSYLVTNTGDVPLTSVVVTDTAVTGAAATGITCPVTTLAVGAQTTCSATGTAANGQFNNTGSVTALFGDVEVTASDSSSYFGSAPAISVDATTNGADGSFIPVGDPVTWSYLVTNTGNVSLTNVGVTDAAVSAVATIDISCTNTTLTSGASTTCTATGTAAESVIDVFFTNSGTASGTPPVGAAVTSTDGSSYFGYVASLTITATLNGVAVPVTAGDPNPVVSSGFTWVFTLTNEGNVGVDGVIVDESGTPVTCDEGALGTVPPGAVSGNPATCTVTQNAPGDLEDPEVTTTFTVTGTDPNGIETSDTTESITYFVGLDCGDDTVVGGPDLADNPLAGFFVGPLKEASECAVPVFIDTTNTLDEVDGEQTVFIGPPDGYDWTGVTGLLTVEWDVEDPADAGVRPTFQDTASGPVEIPICGGDVAVSIIEPSGGDFFYTLNDNPAELNGTYPLATGGGEICLVLHTTKTIPFVEGGLPTVKTVTVEVFYIYDDPQLIRPK